ncbi:MAG TPA: DNA repair protein RecN [Chloroflexota bacterium]
MLLELSVRNFAILDQVTLRWAPGLNVLTGETGAGKSIIVDAVSALMGSRMSADWVRTGADQARIEGIFELPAESRDDDEAEGGSLAALLAAYDLLPDGETTLILSREIARTGRTFCRVNGRPVLLGVLQEIGRRLVDIHGQSEHLSLLRTREHLYLLDRYGGTTAAREELAGLVGELEAVLQALRASDEEERRLAREAALLRHEVAEIESVAPTPGEEAELAAQRDRLRNAERLRALALGAYAALEGGDGETPAALDALGSAAAAAAELSALDRQAAPTRDALDTAVSAVDDCARALRRYAEEIESDPALLEIVDERLHALRELARKYGGSAEAALAYADEARAKLDRLEHHEQHVAHLQAREGELRAAVGARAAALSARRREAASTLAAAVERELADLRMAGARFKVAFATSESADGVPVDGRTLAYDRTGVDRVEFLLAANAGEELRPLARVASGGEMARILLALKTILAGVDVRPTLIFDEVDVGVGGRLGQVLGEKLWQLATRHQILCVTHLPQLAAYGDEHFLVTKAEKKGRTETAVAQLTADTRAVELAAMLGGAGEAARLSARELLEQADQWKDHATKAPQPARSARSTVARR